MIYLRNMIRLNLEFSRLFSSKTVFPQNCGWEEIIKHATSKKEAKRLEPAEETKSCIPSPDAAISVPDKIPDLTPITGVPHAMYGRSTAIIKKPDKNVMQQGTDSTNHYVLSYTTDVQWENPLMGWTSGSNSLKDVEIKFATEEDAVEFAKKNGWDFIVEKELPKKKFKKNYGENFTWNRRTRVSTK